MGLELMIILVAALATIAAGARMMYCGHRHHVRRDRRAGDRRHP